MQPLTKRQREILDYLAEHIRVAGYAPSLAEIGARFGLSSLATVSKHMTNLETKGYIRRKWGHGRSVEILEPQRDDAVTAAFIAGFKAACRGDLIDDALKMFGATTTKHLNTQGGDSTLEGSYTGLASDVAPTSRR